MFSDSLRSDRYVSREINLTKICRAIDRLAKRIAFRGWVFYFNLYISFFYTVYVLRKTSRSCFFRDIRRSMYGKSTENLFLDIN